MELDATSGVFIAIDGPNGVAKSRIVDLVTAKLKQAGCTVVRTKEPTESELGIWIRNKQDSYKGKTLACLIAANRYEHIEGTIRPELMKNAVILSDRYLPSSFVYQIRDGVSEEFLWELNSEAYPPHMTVLLYDDEDVISMRLAQQLRLSRFERDISPREEVQLFHVAAGILQRRGWPVCEYANTENAEQVASSITELVLNLRRGAAHV